METMYDRIKRMDKHEFAEFIYVVYQAGVRDGEQNLCDSPMGFLVAVTSLMIMQKYGCRMINSKTFMMLFISKIMLL